MVQFKLLKKDNGRIVHIAINPDCVESVIEITEDVQVSASKVISKECSKINMKSGKTHLVDCSYTETAAIFKS